MSPIRSALSRRALACAMAGVALLAAAPATAQITWSIGVESPNYQQPVQGLRDPPPVYYEPSYPHYYPPPPPVYVQPPPPVYYPSPQPRYRERDRYYDDRNAWRGGRDAQEQPRLSDMQQRAYDNCAMLARRDQPRCRATVMSTVR